MGCAAAHTVAVSPIGNLQPELTAAVCGAVERIFNLPTAVLPLMDSVDFAFDPTREQYHSTLILEKLATLAPSEAFKVLALVGVDLFIPILTYVYGEAQLGGRACVVSVHRLDEGLATAVQKALLPARVAKEAAHELAHTFDLRHCKDPACIMHYCRTIHDVDRKSDRLCRYCRTLLNDELKRTGR